jgi:hypothetical protein
MSHLKITGATNGDIQQVSYGGPTNIRRRRTKFSHHGNQAPAIYAPLPKHLEIICVICGKKKGSYFAVVACYFSVACVFMIVFDKLKHSLRF